MIDFIILTTEQSEKAQTLHDENNAMVQPRIIDAEIEGTGKFVLPARILDDPTYQTHCPQLIEFLRTLPIVPLDPDVIFLPPPPEE